MIVGSKEEIQSAAIGCFPTLSALWSTFPRSVRIHMEKVGEYSDIMYQYMLQEEIGDIRRQMGTDFKEYSRWIFTLHDIGRFFIPFAVLNKVENLTTDELQIIKDHTVNARRAIKSIYQSPFEEEVMEQWEKIAVYHHERYDGGGYPEGLTGKEIPLGARICAIADTYDGIVSWKPYKKKQTTKEEAVLIIEKESGKQFEPELVDIFKKCVGRF